MIQPFYAIPLAHCLIEVLMYTDPKVRFKILLDDLIATISSLICHIQWRRICLVMLLSFN